MSFHQNRPLVPTFDCDHVGEIFARPTPMSEFDLGADLHPGNPAGGQSMKKFAIAFLACLAMVAVASFAAAQCPNLDGAWSTTTGTMIGGRASEAWCGAGYPVQAGVPGNTENAMSWDGSTLGTEWKAWGMQIDANGAVLISDTVVGGNGTLTYRTNYDGGQFWLTKDNTWADGLADLTGYMTSYVVFTTVTYWGGAPQGATSNISFTGTFSNCSGVNGCEIQFAIANAIKIWDTGYLVPMPVGYPGFLCSATQGELFDACCITVGINCVVDNDQPTWGSLKATYK